MEDVKLKMILLSGILTVSSAGSSCINTIGTDFSSGKLHYSGMPESLDAGSKFTVTGSVNKDAEEFRFKITHYWNEVLFRMSVNFTAGQVEFLSVNFSRSDPDPFASVQPEKRSLGPFGLGKDFVVDISAVDEKSYTIAVNKEEFFNFSSQMSVTIGKVFIVEGDVTLDRIQLNGEDLPHTGGQVANFSNTGSTVSVGDKIIVDLTTLGPRHGFATFTINLCYKSPEQWVYATKCPYVMGAVEEMGFWGDPYLLAKDTKYSFQFELMKDTVQLSVNGNFGRNLSYNGMSPQEVTYVDVFGGVMVNCIRFEPAASS